MSGAQLSEEEDAVGVGVGVGDGVFAVSACSFDVMVTLLT